MHRVHVHRLAPSLRRSRFYCVIILKINTFSQDGEATFLPLQVRFHPARAAAVLEAWRARPLRPDCLDAKPSSTTHGPGDLTS